MFLNEAFSSQQASSNTNSDDDGVAIIIGKSFEAKTLPDGSQEVIATTRYRRVNDGFIWTESNVMQLNEIEDMMRDTGVEDQVVVEKKNKNRRQKSTAASAAPTWSVSYSSSESVGTADAAELDAALSSSPSDSRYMPEHVVNNGHNNMTMYRQTMMNAHHPPVMTPQPQYNNRGNNRVALFAPTISFGDESSVYHHPENMNYPTPTAAAESEGGNNQGFDAYNGDDDSVVIIKAGQQRKRWCMVLFISVFLIIGGGVAAATFYLKPWVASDTSSNQAAPETNDKDAVDVAVDVADILAAAADVSDSDNDMNVEPPSNEAEKNEVVDEIDAEIDPNIEAEKNGGDEETTAAVIDGEVGMETAADIENSENVSAADFQEVQDADMSSAFENENTVANTEDVKNEEEVIIPCIQLKIKTEADESTDITPWSLSRLGENDTAVTIGAGESISFVDPMTFDGCVDPGVYTFHISDSAGNGLGERGSTGYIISADGIDLGVSTWFLHDEKMTFTLPLVDEAESGVCTDDFLLIIKTDNKPEEMHWDVVDNESGETLLKGGPYLLPQSVHTHRACLSSGNYTFNMHDSFGDGICCGNGRGFFSLYKDGVEVVDSNGQYGYNESTIFVLGNHTSAP